MSDEVAHSSQWETAEIVFGIPILIAIALHFVVPLSMPGGRLRPVFILGGAALVIIGIAFIVLGRREFARHGQPTDPGRPTRQVITTGVFSISRNPLYFGAACLVAGVALAVNIPWLLILLLPGLVACHYVLIAPEERYLDNKFGEEYRVYADTVHRWIGRARTPRQPE